MAGTLVEVATSPARCVTAIGAVSLVSAIGTIASPLLVSSPLALVVLSPRLPFLVLASAHVSPLVLIPLAVARLCATDLFHYQLGRRGRDHDAAAWLGELAIIRWLRSTRPHRWIEHARARCDRHRQFVERSVIVAVLLRPVGRHLALAGATGARPRAVIVADVAGTAAYVALVVVGIGWFGS